MLLAASAAIAGFAAGAEPCPLRTWKMMRARATATAAMPTMLMSVPTKAAGTKPMMK